MDSLQRLFAENPPTTLSFDCYGTLVDWESGAVKALRRIYGFSHSLVSDDALIDMFLELDATIIRGKLFPYRAVLQEVAGGIADKLLGETCLDLDKAFARSLPNWPVFSETNEALLYLSKHFRLAIISNVDDELIAGTLTQIDASFDVVTTSQQTRCYKPNKAIFEIALRRLGETPRKVIHIAEGLCEAKPAEQLGMKSVWVERSHRSDDGSMASPHARAPNLKAIVDAARLNKVS